MIEPPVISSPDAEDPDDWIDRALADDAAAYATGYVCDDGFTGRVMRELPVSDGLPAWRQPVVAMLWLCTAALLAVMLPGAAQEITRGAFKLFAARPFSLSTLAFVLLAVGAATWTLAAIALRRAVESDF